MYCIKTSKTFSLSYPFVASDCVLGCLSDLNFFRASVLNVAKEDRSIGVWPDMGLGRTMGGNGGSLPGRLDFELLQGHVWDQSWGMNPKHPKTPQFIAWIYPPPKKKGRRVFINPKISWTFLVFVITWGGFSGLFGDFHNFREGPSSSNEVRFLLQTSGYWSHWWHVSS